MLPDPTTSGAAWSVRWNIHVPILRNWPLSFMPKQKQTQACLVEIINFGAMVGQQPRLFGVALDRVCSWCQKSICSPSGAQSKSSKCQSNKGSPYLLLTCAHGQHYRLHLCVCNRSILPCLKSKFHVTCTKIWWSIIEANYFSLNNTIVCAFYSKVMLFTKKLRSWADFGSTERLDCNYFV